MTRILLINPPNAVPKDWNFPIAVFQPLGLAYIAAVLEENEYTVSILDAIAEGWKKERVIDGMKFTGLSYEEIGDKIKKYSPEIVGISAPFTSQADCALKIANVVKNVDKDITTIIGGAHASVRPEDCLSNPNVDYVVIGEGEHTVLELVEKIQTNPDAVNNIKGIAYKNNAIVVKTPARPFIEDLDSIPFPARHLLPMQSYFEAAKNVRSSRSISTFNKRWATVITSRGCPFGCIFCSIHTVMGRKWRARSPENVVDEIEHLVNEYRVQHLDIEDDNLTLDKKRAEKIFDLMMERGLDIEWSTPNGVRADTLDENLIIKMKKSGCKRIIVAPESGNQQVIDNIIKKKINLNKVEEVVKLCKKHKLLVESFFVIGFPGETKENIRETIEYEKKLRKLGVDDCATYIATPFYGTGLYKIAKENGYLRGCFKEDALNTLSGEPLIETPEFTANELKELYQEALKVNPPISIGRLKLAITMLLRDPLRAVVYIKEQLHKS